MCFNRLRAKDEASDPFEADAPNTGISTNSDPAPPPKRLRLDPADASPVPGTASNSSLNSSNSIPTHLQGLQPPVSPVVLGFQLAQSDPASHDTVQSALRMKEQQQSLIRQRHLQQESNKTAGGASPSGPARLPEQPPQAGSSSYDRSGGSSVPTFHQEPPTPDVGNMGAFNDGAHDVHMSSNSGRNPGAADTTRPVSAREAFEAGDGLDRLYN